MESKQNMGIIEKIEDLANSTNCSNVTWSAWELEFIESINEKYEQYGYNLQLSEKQENIINKLWERL